MQQYISSTLFNINSCLYRQLNCIPNLIVFRKLHNEEVTDSCLRCINCKQELGHAQSYVQCMPIKNHCFRFSNMNKCILFIYFSSHLILFQDFAPLVEQFTQRVRILSVRTTPIIAAVWKVVGLHQHKWDSRAKSFVMLLSLTSKSKINLRFSFKEEA